MCRNCAARSSPSFLVERYLFVFYSIEKFSIYGMTTYFTANILSTHCFFLMIQVCG